MIFVCWKWRGEGHGFGTVYAADHVNRLRSMLVRHCRGAHELVCITDDPTGIDGDVRIVPLWDDLAKLGRCWRRLRLFAPEMRELIGPRFVSIDLDCVIVDDVTPLFDRSEPFVIWGPRHRKAPYCGSLWMADAGAHADLWTKFDEVLSPAVCRRFVGSDQAWIAYYLGADQPTWSGRNGVRSFRLNCVPKLWRDRVERMTTTVDEPPPGTRLVFFHGRYDPSQQAVQRAFPWVQEHWR